MIPIEMREKVKPILKSILILLIIVLLLMPAIPNALGQTQGVIRTNLIHTVELEDSMNLKLYFNLYDPSSGLPFTHPRPTSAQITLVNTGYTSPAIIQTPDLPIYITLLLDASSTMMGNAQNLRDAAKISLSNPPDNAHFGVVQFNEEINLLQDFTQNLPLVSFAIDQYNASNQGACLYDAIYLSVEALSDAPVGRRAVILFTDGIDKKLDGTTCSQQSYQELVAKALELDVPIHTIGLLREEGNINEPELQNMAGTTGGYSAFAALNDLPDAFTKIMDAMKTQLMVEATIYPERDQNQAVLTLILEDGSSLNTAFFVESQTSYPGPPSPVTLRMDGLQLIAETQSYDLQMAVSTPELVSYVKVALWDKSSGSKVTDLIFNDPVEFNQFSIPTELLSADRDYELRISAISRDDNSPFVLAVDRQGQPTYELIHEFSFDPSGIFPSINIDSVTQAGSSLFLNVSLFNPQLISGYEGWLVDKATNTQVRDSRFLLPADAADDGQIELPTREMRLPTGTYMVVLRVLNDQNQVLMTTQFDEITFVAPGLFQRVGVALIAMPIFIFLIVGMVMALVLFLMINASKQKNISSTPVIKDQLGKGKKKTPAFDGLQAIASDEPYLAKDKGTVSTPQSKPISKQPASTQDATVLFDEQDVSDRTVIFETPLVNSQLTIIKGSPSVTCEITKSPFIVGRTDVDMVLNAASVSRQHIEIVFDEKQNFFITDLNSSNGTRLNGQRIKSGQTVPLPEGALIELGPEVALKFERK